MTTRAAAARPVLEFLPGGWRIPPWKRPRTIGEEGCWRQFNAGEVDRALPSGQRQFQERDEPAVSVERLLQAAEPPGGGAGRPTTSRDQRVPVRAEQGGAPSSGCCRCTWTCRSCARSTSSMGERARRAMTADGRRDQERQGDGRAADPPVQPRARQAAITKELMRRSSAAKRLQDDVAWGRRHDRRAGDDRPPGSRAKRAQVEVRSRCGRRARARGRRGLRDQLCRRCRWPPELRVHRDRGEPRQGVDLVHVEARRPRRRTGRRARRPCALEHGERAQREISHVLDLRRARGPPAPFVVAPFSSMYLRGVASRSRRRGRRRSRRRCSTIASSSPSTAHSISRG